ncbi:hypothetical protein DOTSEDRAFT_26361 [Dothistroma septosporum NZE10]|uniref:F-box domain-containing protein n=1 Tax=Dothistroma septosporum (strain NZE10 / CBS 128990) TaxID=675120 RepID=N1PGB5_DOTSN|nr:hypothetical protein DOTSEDRAFT_26361 [Dothistroma septosporum NZE10]
MAKITDLPPELLLDIFQDLATDHILKLRLCCRDLVAPANTLIQRRMKCLYIHPSTTSLRMLKDFCNHPLWASEVSKVTFLGEHELELIPQQVPLRANEKVWQKWSQIFAPWPVMFPQSKASKIGTVEEQDAVERLVLEEIILCLAKLPSLKEITFAPRLDEPGFNQVTQAIIKSHGRKHYEQHRRKNSRASEKRMTDFQLLMEVVTSSRLLITDLAFHTALPFADDRFRLRNLIRLTLTLDHGNVPSMLAIQANDHRDHQRLAHPEARRWIRRCARLLKTASNLERLSIFLRGTNRSKYPLRNYSLAESGICNLNFPKLQHFEIVRQHDPWWRPCIQRPILEVLEEGTWHGFLQHHAEMSLREIAIDNILVISTSDNDPTENMETVIELPRSDMRTSYIVNRFEHHRNCKISHQQPMNVAACKAGCGIYCLDDAGESTQTSDLELFATLRGVELTDGEAWDFGNCTTGQVD